ncbi:60S ribosomal protein L6-like [Oopsacas minuta]|uniref:Large ribosomal subunit protein eL6 n=1 Tax=Oopsacas minuta TaxID=111878 RepID=A0AAV7JB71_9METZ|nr:60S ribosomal protein L6-like [Oopsacas minuta]
MTITKKHCSRNPKLASTVGRYSRTVMKRRRGTFHRIKAYKPQEKVVEKKKRFVLKKLTTQSGPQQRKVYLKKSHRWYPTQDSPKRKKSTRRQNPTHLRGSITRGTILILLGGKHKGKRVVFLKQLKSGLLLVTGPYPLNGIPLRRVDQAYVIATQTKIKINDFAVPPAVTDSYFKRKRTRAKKGKESLFAPEETKSVVTTEMKEIQKQVDTLVIKAIQAREHVDAYLRTKFSLKKGQYPHEMKF